MHRRIFISNEIVNRKTKVFIKHLSRKLLFVVREVVLVI